MEVGVGVGTLARVLGFFPLAPLGLYLYEWIECGGREVIAPSPISSSYRVKLRHSSPCTGEIGKLSSAAHVRRSNCADAKIPSYAGYLWYWWHTTCARYLCYRHRTTYCIGTIHQSATTQILIDHQSHPLTPSLSCHPPHIPILFKIPHAAITAFIATTAISPEGVSNATASNEGSLAM